MILGKNVFGFVKFTDFSRKLASNHGVGWGVVSLGKWKKNNLSMESCNI